jgi:cytoskeletal protein RodZ
MRQKIDIADVESATKIRAKYLRALENEEFGLLPGPTFVKTFLRTYAEYLGLDATLLVEEYRVSHEPRGEEFGRIDPTVARTTRRRARAGGGGGGRRDRGPRVGPPGPGAVFGVVLVLLLVVILVLGFTGDNGSKDDTTPQSSQPDQSRASQTAEQKRKERARKKKERDAAAARRTVKLRLVPAEPTYACVVDGSGKQKFGGTLSAPQSFSGKRLRINLGRTTVRVTVNGKRLAIPAGSNPVGYDLRAGKKPKSLALGQRPNC